MPKYRVGVREVHIAYYEVEAEDAAHAKEKVYVGDEDASDIDELEYVERMDSSTWDVAAI